MPRKSQTNSFLFDGSIRPSVLVNTSLNPAFFQHISRIYRERTGFHLVYADVHGCIQMGLPDCDIFPCMKTCKECREAIIKEALRTGKICLDRCHQGFILWGLPVAVGCEIVGGFVVIGINDKKLQVGNVFRKGCVELYSMMHEYELLPEEYFREPFDPETAIRFIHRETFMGMNTAVQDCFRRYLDALHTAEFPKADLIFKEIISIFEKQENLPVDLMKGFAADFLFQAQKRFISAGFEDYVCMSEVGSLINSVAEVKNPKELVHAMGMISERFGRLARQSTKDQDEVLIEKVVSYLEENIRERLTRETVAQGVGISPSHLSRLLKKKKNRTFTDLLNQYRIERACKLLVRSSKTLADVANDTGFCDQSYFSKVFRHYKLVTPAEFRAGHIVE